MLEDSEETEGMLCELLDRFDDAEMPGEQSSLVDRRASEVSAEPITVETVTARKFVLSRAGPSSNFGIPSAEIKEPVASTSRDCPDGELQQKQESHLFDRYTPAAE